MATLPTISRAALAGRSGQHFEELDQVTERVGEESELAADGRQDPRLGDGNTPPAEMRPYTDLGDSLKYRGYHHFCLNVASVDDTIVKLRERGVVIVTAPFVLTAISRKLAFFADPFGNLVELAELLP